MFRRTVQKITQTAVKLPLRGFARSRLGSARGWAVATTGLSAGLGATALAHSAEEASEDGEEGDKVRTDFVPGQGLTVLTEQSTSMVLGNGKQDVFLMVFADWCHKCAGLKFVYGQVAEALKDVPIVVAMVDGTNFKPPGFTKEQERGFPRLRLYPAGSPVDPEAEPATYYMEPKLSARVMLAFIHKHSSVKFDLEGAMARSDALDEATLGALSTHIQQSILDDERANVTFQLTALGPCNDIMRKVFLQWRMSEYTESKPGEDGNAGMAEVQKCLASKKNEDFWLEVVDMAIDQVRVSEKSQKKYANEAATK